MGVGMTGSRLVGRPGRFFFTPDGLYNYWRDG